MADIVQIAKPLVGLDGRPLVPVKTDLSDLDAQQQQTLGAMLLVAGRMLRDGKSIGQIRVALHGESGLGVTDKVMENFARRGLAILEERIAAGIEPAETVHTEMVDQLDVEFDANIDADMIDPTGVNNVDRGYLQDMS